MKEERVETPMGAFVLKELTWGEYNDILKDSVVVKVYPNGATDTRVDMIKFKELLVLKSIKEAPFGKPTIQKIRNLPVEVGELLYRKAMEINPFLANIE